MGEKSEFEPGDKAPNDALYIEIGEIGFPTQIQNPQQIRLNKGDTFPATTNKDRKWKKKAYFS